MNTEDYDFRADVARLIADPPLQPRAISNYMARSKPGRQYASDPFPPPTAYFRSGEVILVDPEKFYEEGPRLNRRGWSPMWHHKTRQARREWHARVLGGGRPGARKAASG
ncbi:hypothetical protein [Micromonospora maritima]|uniref:hypothetical protein n=1 Tax=Micromonospora maritima TaxID=986711 RepID=UPI00157D8241|nr:hypothetical protein [Micromonospora maritima]